MTATELYTRLIVMAIADAVPIIAGYLYYRYKRKQQEKQSVWEALKQ